VRALGIVSKWFSRGGAVIAALVVCSCAFVLDFDKFERCAECEDVVWCKDDNHSCIQNGCQPKPDDNPLCEERETSESEMPDAGQRRCMDESVLLSEYATFEPAEADVILQAEVLATSTRIYHAVYLSNGGKTDILLRAFDTTGEKLGAPNAFAAPVASVRLSELLKGALSNGQDAEPDTIVAPLAMVPTPDQAGGLTLYTAIAEPGVQTADVVQIQLEATWPEQATPKLLTEIPNFKINESAGRAGPAAGTLANGEPFVVWQGCQPDGDVLPIEKDLCKPANVTPGAIYSHVGSVELDRFALAAQGIPEDLLASSIRALSGGSRPAAVWAVSALGDDTQVFVRAGLPAMDPAFSTELLQCDDSTKGVQWLSAAPIWGPVSSVSWTKGSAAAEATRVQCLDDTCRDLANTPDAGETDKCSTSMINNRVFHDVGYVIHGVWADSNADEAAHTVVAFTKPMGDKHHVFATAATGLPDPNLYPLIGRSPELALDADNPSKVVLSLQKYESKAKRAVAAVGWVERGKKAPQAARLSALDLCLPDLNSP
jgi:hypothetical protein